MWWVAKRGANCHVPAAIRAAVLTILALALAPASAYAGSYDVRLCADAVAHGFSVRNDNTGVFTTVAECPARANDPYSGLAAKVEAGPLGPPPGARAAWTVTAPAGTTLRSLKVRRRIEKADANYEVAVVTAEGIVLDGCAVERECSNAGTETYHPATTRSITFSVGCAVSVCVNSAAGSRALVAVNEATATVDDPAPPVVTPPSGAWQRAAEVAISAEDAGGVRATALSTGASRELACDFTHLQPCPGSVTTSLPTDLPDGVHALTATATDAGGQTASVPVILRVDRQAPGPPAGLTIQQREDDTYVYAWRNPEQQGAAPIAAARLSDGTVVRGANIERLEAKTGDMRVWLEDEAGNADPANAAGAGGTSAVGTQRPILRTSASRLKIVRARRSGRRLVVRGTVVRSANARVTATLTRGKRVLRGSAKPRNGRWTIRIRLRPATRRSGVLTVRYGGEAVRKRLKA